MRKIRLMTILNQYLKIFDLEKIGWSCSDLFSTELDGTRTEIGSKKRYKFFRKFYGTESRCERSWYDCFRMGFKISKWLSWSKNIHNRKFIIAKYVKTLFSSKSVKDPINEVPSLIVIYFTKMLQVGQTSELLVIQTLWRALQHQLNIVTVSFALELLW